jgi:hypothetical protein
MITEDKSNKFKIGLDLHGVLTELPHFFSFLTKSLVDAGAEVHIITGGATEEDMEFLKKHDIRYTHYFSIVDYHKSVGTPTRGKHSKYGFDLISDEIWDKTKGEYCQMHGIDLHIDDTQNYQSFFKSPFCLFTLNKPQK